MLLKCIATAAECSILSHNTTEIPPINNVHLNYDHMMQKWKWKLRNLNTAAVSQFVSAQMIYPWTKCIMHDFEKKKNKNEMIVEKKFSGFLLFMEIYLNDVHGVIYT